MTERIPDKPTDGHLRRHQRPDNRLAIRNILNILFMIVALITMVVYVALPMPQYSLLFVCTGVVAIALKIAEIILRYMP